jgi:hypothetical protein
MEALDMPVCKTCTRETLAIEIAGLRDDLMLMAGDDALEPRDANYMLIRIDAIEKDIRVFNWHDAKAKIDDIVNKAGEAEIKSYQSGMRPSDSVYRHTTPAKAESSYMMLEALKEEAQRLKSDIEKLSASEPAAKAEEAPTAKPADEHAGEDDSLRDLFD